MKHTKRKYSKTRRCKKRRNRNKTNKIPIINKKQRKTRKQRGSGKYKPNDIYDIEQFIINDCLNTLKNEKNLLKRVCFQKCSSHLTHM
jgi:hypothetical protein